MITAGSSSELTIMYFDAAGNSASTRSPSVEFVATFSGPAPLIASDPSPWLMGEAYDSSGCVSSYADVRSNANVVYGRQLTYLCTLAGLYTLTVKLSGVVIKPGPMSIQVLPGKPAEKWSTAYAPASMMAGTCADVFVRLRDELGNGKSAGFQRAPTAACTAPPPGVHCTSLSQGLSTI